MSLGKLHKEQYNILLKFCYQAIKTFNLGNINLSIMGGLKVNFFIISSLMEIIW